MQTQQIRGIILLLGIIISAVVYETATSKPLDPGLKQAQFMYEAEKIQLKREHLKRYYTLKYYGIIGLLGAANLALIIIASGYARARVKLSSVHTARIGKHSEIPVHHKDLQNFYPIAVNLSMAEIEASVSTSHENAYQISRQMIEDITSYTRTIVGKRGLLSSGFGQGVEFQPALLPVQTPVPSFAELLKNGMVAPGKALVLGFHQGQAQYRSLKDLKSVAIAGWQGSGKTQSTAYIVASSVLACGVHVYIIDPHKNHEEGLYSLIKPLEKTGHVTVINPFDTSVLISNLNKVLDRRLSGQEPNTPGILLVIDELERLAKMDCFDVLVKFLERCTEETRKANITFIGSSHKWTARHFKGRADIRGCMNSMLIHKTKPSQADLLIEDSQDKNLVKQIQRPGEAILVTDFDNPILVSMPRCTYEDMKSVADIVKKTYPPQQSQKFSPNLQIESEIMSAKEQNRDTLSFKKNSSSGQQKVESNAASSDQSVNSPTLAEKTTASSSPGSTLISFDLFRRKRKKAGASPVFDAKKLTLEQIQEQFQKRKKEDKNFTQAELARQSELSPGHLSKILRGQRPLSNKNKLKLYKTLFIGKTLETPAIRR